MAGNPHQERKTTANNVGKGKVSKITLAEALGATHQNTVPVLPALDPLNHPQSPTGSDRPATSKSPDLSGRIQQPSKSTESATSGLDRAGAPMSPAEPATSARAIVDQEVTRSLAKAQLVLPDIIADSIPLEDKATNVLPGQPTGLVTSGEPRPLAVLEQEAEAPAIFIRGARQLPRHHYARVVPRRTGPPPMAVQFMVAMMSVMVLFTIFTAVSPLGKSLTSLDFVEAYSNSVPWVPTATPRPTPKPAPVYTAPIGSNVGTQTVINEIVSVFGGYAQGALNVASCESGYDPSAYNPYAIGNSHAEGVFQILYPSTWDTTTYANDSPYNADLNINAAYQIFARDGYSWQEWACQP